MPMNTPYLGSQLVSSVSSTNAGYGAMNTPYLGTGSFQPAISSGTGAGYPVTELTSAVSIFGPLSVGVGAAASGVVSGSPSTTQVPAALKVWDSILTSMAAIAVPNAGQAEVQVKFSGSAVTDNIIVGLPSAVSAGLTAVSYVSSTNTVVLRWVNASASTVTEAAQVIRFTRLGW